MFDLLDCSIRKLTLLAALLYCKYQRLMESRPGQWTLVGLTSSPSFSPSLLKLLQS